MEPHLRSHRVNHSFASLAQRDLKRFEVHANVAISVGPRNDRMHSCTSSGKSLKHSDDDDELSVRFGSFAVFAISILLSVILLLLLLLSDGIELEEKMVIDNGVGGVMVDSFETMESFLLS